MERLKRIVVQMMLVLLFVPYLGTAEPTIKPTVLSKTEKPAEGQVEMLEERTPTSKTYIKSDGSKQLVASQSPIHYEKTENGIKQYFDIDPTLVESKKLGFIGTGEYKNKSNNFDLKVTKNLQSKVFSLEKDGVKIEEFLSNISSSESQANVEYSSKLSKVESEQSSNKIVYKNVAKDTDLTVYSVPDGLKEYITLNNYNGQNVFDFEFKIDGAYFEKQEDGGYKFFKDGTKDEVFNIPRFFMWDSKGGADSEENQYSYDIVTELNKVGDRYKFTIKASNDWLSSKDRVFPIIIDPSFATYSAEDTYVQSGYPTTRAWDQRAIYVGVGSTKGVNRAEIKFDLPDLRGARIDYAQFDVYQYANCYGSCTWSNVNAYTTGWFNPWDVHWYNQPGLVSHVGSARQTAAYGWVSMGVTGAVQQWFPNYYNYGPSHIGGLALFQSVENSWGYRTLASRNNPDYSWGQPKLTINYNDYNVSYNPTIITEGIAGTTIDVPVGLVNTGRNTWFKGGANPTKLGYHLVNNATGEEVIWDGGWNEIPFDIGRGGSGTAIARVKLPPISGSYTIKFDLVHSGITWYSHQGIATANQTINVYPPSMSSMNHMGQESYYTMAGPVDLMSGNLSYSATDLSVNSNTGGLSFSRSYNSNQDLKTFNHDSNGYIRSWLINGPYKNNDQVSRLSREYLSLESNVRPNTFSNSNNNVWLPASEPTTSHMQYDWVFEGTGAYQRGRATNAAAYSHVYVFSPEERDVKLKIGSDEGNKIWLNGNLVSNTDIYRVFALDQEEKIVKLSAGWNSLLVKLSQKDAGWNMSARFLNMSNQVMSDLKYSLNNPELYSKNGILGSGWTSNLEEALFTVNVNDIYYKDSTGSVNQYVFNGSSYSTPPGSDFALSRSGSDYLLTNKEGVSKRFNSTGLLQEIRDLSGNSTVFSRNDLGQVISMTDSIRSLSFSYNSDGTLTSTSNAAGQSIVYNYENGRLVRVIDNDGYSYKYKYNLEGRLTEYVDKKDNFTKFEYIGSKVNKSIDALNNITTISYLAGKTELVDAKGRKNTYSFDGANLLSMSTNAKNYSERYVYDKRYNRVQMMPDFNVNDADFYVYKYTFDVNDNLLSERDPLDAVTAYTYSNNDLVKVVDPKGAITEKTYSTDGRRLLLSDKDAEGNITRYEYDLLGRKTAIISPKGEKITTNYNEFGDVISVTSPKGETTSFEYDLAGRKTKEISPLGKESLYYYDSLSRISRIVAPGYLVTQYEYDPNGNKVKEINPNDTYKTWTYDLLNRVTVQRDEAGYETRYEYDAVGNKIKQIDAKGKVTAYDYDELNQLVKEYDATGIASTIGYNKNGDAVAVTDSKGQSSSQTLDKAGQVKSEIKAEGTTSYSYDATGNVTSLVSPKETLNVTYNKNGDVVTESSTQTGLVSRTYDSNQVQASVQTTAAKTDFVYDQNGEVSEVKATVQGTTSPALTLFSSVPAVSIPATPGSSTFKRDAEGKLSNIAKANGDIVSFTYDISGRVSNINVKNKDLVTLADYTYQYDKVSNQTQIVDKNGRVFNYTYDARNQLLSDNVATYTYDAVGNRTEMATASGVVKYYYDNEKYGNRLTRVEYPNGRTVSYEYDNNGNATKKIDSIGGTTTYRYDSEDYFVEAVLADGTKVEYSYDEVSKRRTQRKVTKPSGQTDITKFTFDGDKLMSEMDATGKILRSYTWDENENLLSVAMPDVSGALKYYYFVKNAKGDIVGLTDSEGKLVAEYEYDSWGNILKAETLDTSLGANFAKTNPRLYASYWYDDVLGQYFMKTRMYDAEIGRFYSQDPIQDEGENLSQNPYLYCSNNPIDRVDPDGKSWFKSSFNWISKNKTAIIAGIAIAAGVGLSLTGVGSFAGAALIGAASGALIEGGTAYAGGARGWNLAGKATKGAVIGGLTGGAGHALTTLKLAQTSARSAYKASRAAGMRPGVSGTKAHTAWTNTMKSRGIPGVYNQKCAAGRVDWKIGKFGFDLKPKAQIGTTAMKRQFSRYRSHGYKMFALKY